MSEDHRETPPKGRTRRTRSKEVTVGEMPRTLPQTSLSRILDGFIQWVGNLVSWLWVVLVLIIVANVVLRYFFARGLVQLEELQWHLYAIGFLIGLSYCVARDSHVRVDVLHMNFALTTKAWIELAGILCFMVPFFYLIMRYSVPFIAESYRVNEISPDPGGLPYRYVIKSFLFIAFALLAVAAFSRLTRVTAHLFGFPRPLYGGSGDTSSGE